MQLSLTTLAIATSLATSALAAKDIFGSDHAPGCQSCVDSLNLACEYRTAFDEEYLACLCDPDSETGGTFASCIQSSECKDENAEDAAGIVAIGSEACAAFGGGGDAAEETEEEGSGSEEDVEGGGAEEGDLTEEEDGDETTTGDDEEVDETTETDESAPSSTPTGDSGALANSASVFGLLVAAAFAIGV